MYHEFYFWLADFRFDIFQPGLLILFRLKVCHLFSEKKGILGEDHGS